MTRQTEAEGKEGEGGWGWRVEGGHNPANPRWPLALGAEHFACHLSGTVIPPSCVRSLISRKPKLLLLLDKQHPKRRAFLTFSAGTADAHSLSSLLLLLLLLLSARFLSLLSFSNMVISQ